ncbi:MAG: nuclear transport factor 2 family protein [Actinomycetota bacterium]
MTDHPNAAIARTAIEAFSRGDMAAMLELVDDTVVWHAPGTNRFSGKFEGKAALIDRFTRMAEAGVVTTLEIHDVVGNDDHVVALVNATVMSADGRSYQTPQVQAMHIRDGRCMEFWGMNQDQAAMDEILG